MKGESHLVVGLAGALALQLAHPYLPGAPVALAACLGANLIGSLLPDVDSDESLIRQYTGTNRKAGCIGALVSFSVRILGGHRAVTHTAIIAGLVALAAWRSGWPWLLAFAAGYAAHLLADMLTMAGIPLLWPVTDRRIHLLPRGLRITTGTPVEYIITVAVGVWAYNVLPALGLAVTLPRW